MYEYIRGTVAEAAPTHAVLDVGGVGYYLHISLETFSAIEHAQTAKLFVHYVVREDAQLLYGLRPRPSASCSGCLSACRASGAIRRG